MLKALRCRLPDALSRTAGLMLIAIAHSFKIFYVFVQWFKKPKPSPMPPTMMLQPERPLHCTHHLQGAALEQTAASFILEMVHKYPGEVSILALASLTNIAQALMIDPSVAQKWGELVVLGGAFFVNGNVNPAAEANVFGDAEAADFVLGQSDNIKVGRLPLRACMQSMLGCSSFEPH